MARVVFGKTDNGGPVLVFLPEEKKEIPEICQFIKDTENKEIQLIVDETSLLDWDIVTEQ